MPAKVTITPKTRPSECLGEKCNYFQVAQEIGYTPLEVARICSRLILNLTNNLAPMTTDGIQIAPCGVKLLQDKAQGYTRR